MGEWLAVGAIGTVLVSTWSYIRGWATQLWSMLFVTVTIRPALSWVVETHIWQNYKPVKFGPRTFNGLLTYVNTSERQETVGLECADDSGRMFWKGWLLIWMQRSDGGSNEKRASDGYSVRLTYIRGTLDMDTLIRAAAKEYDHRMMPATTAERKRATISHRYGTARRNKDSDIFSHGSGSDAPIRAASPHSDATNALINRLITHKPEEIGFRLAMTHTVQIDDMALDADGLAAYADMQRWYKSKEWYQARRIPWRRGYLLSGPPGCGKTSFARATATAMDLPIVVLHLETMRNEELQQSWEALMHDSPCVALVEDIDTIFNGRETLAGEVTFDAFLNCVDGVTTASGIVLMITTNFPEKLDIALAGGGKTNRPGRIDRSVTFNALTQDGRRRLAARILCDYPDAVEEMVAKHADTTGAQFQELCIQLALERYWSEQPQGNINGTCPVHSANAV